MQLQLNLANRPYLNRRVAWRWLLLVCGFLVVSLTLNLFYGLQNYRQLDQLDIRTRELNAQLAELKGVPEAYSPESFARVKQQTSNINQIIAADQFQWTHLLDRLEALVPDEVGLSGIQPVYKDHSLNVSGFARDVSAMTRFLDELLASPDFNQVYLLSQSETESAKGGAVLVNFKLVIRGAF